MTKQQIIGKAEKAESILRNVYSALAEINKDCQFDYVTSSRLGDVVLNIEDVVKKIGKIVWQK